MNEQHPNLEIIGKFFAAYGNFDAEAMKEVVAEDVKWTIPGHHPMSGTKVGITEVLAYFAKLSESGFKADPIVLGVNDDYVIDCHRGWSNREDGNNVDMLWCLLWKIKDGKIVEVVNFAADQHEADRFFYKAYQLKPIQERMA
ncbi:MAG TPA: nuclear transport factor 2 family protein [Chitinophaga sp.]|uniref:nuclear transport factor 2 family protein n=1 Tax=Chitinophaga sp. TaxID=1869181 RepID=UPI002B917CA4|nr:nuclear transport factor 2 family protein [Chitinophaga sp.]HVI47267.1 nuclear transport factor 2 family protein [Chitinophaga sp.]